MHVGHDVYSNLAFSIHVDQHLHKPSHSGGGFERETQAGQVLANGGFQAGTLGELVAQGGGQAGILSSKASPSSSCAAAPT